MKDCLTQGAVIPDDMITELRDSTDKAGDGAELARRLEADGYIFMRGVVGCEAIAAARREVFERLEGVGEIKAPAVDGIATGESRRRELAEDLGEFWLAVCEGEARRCVTHGAELRKLMTSVLGEPAQPHDYLFLRPGAVGRSTQLHYDRPFFSRGSDRIYTVWGALGDIPVTEGPLVVVEGSNGFTDLIEQAHAIDYESKSSPLVAILDDVVTLAKKRGSRLLTANFTPGDVIVFGMSTLHGTLDNHSPACRVRLSFDVRYQPLADPVDDRYSGPNPGGTTGIGYGELNGAKPLTEPWHTR